MKERIVATVRTSVQVAVGLAIGWLVTGLASVGVDIAIGPDVIDTLANGVSILIGAVIVGVWVFIQRAIEDRFPWVAKVMSLGLSGTGPTYTG